VERNRGGIIMCRMLSHRNGPQQSAEGEARIERGLVLWAAVRPRRSSTSKKQPTLDRIGYSVLAHIFDQSRPAPLLKVITLQRLIARPSCLGTTAFGECSASRSPTRGRICRSCHPGFVSALQAIVILHTATCAYF
jgi:hypothetical protein